MRANVFTETGVKKMLSEARERRAMARAGLWDERRVEAAANISVLCGHEVKMRWQRLLDYYEDVELLALALLADVE